MKNNVVLVTLSVLASLFVFYTLFFSSSWKLIPRLKPYTNIRQTRRRTIFLGFEKEPPQQLETETKELFTRFGIEKSTKLSVGTKTLEKRSPRSNLIILSPGRGGSSFLGGVFDANPDNMYWFEPLHTLSRGIYELHLFKDKERRIQYSKTSIDLINSFLDCNFTQIPKDIISALSKSIFRSRSTSLSSEHLCRTKNKTKKCLPYSVKLLGEVCNSTKHTVLKILTSRLPRYTLESFQGIFQKQKYKVKAIHLVRDPRAVIYSMVNSVQWINISSFLNQRFRDVVQGVCNPIEKNIKFGLFSPPSWLKNRFRVIRYEDFIVNTTIMARDLYKFAEFDWSVSVDEWIATHRTKPRSNNETDPYSLYREASLVINKWKKASPSLITVVEEVCGNLMDMLGYKRVIKSEEKVARNRSSLVIT
ncbi:carbohydrate sulfotransferase 3-like [Stylophora pistillata]|uniref:carbohydrate sulfotransferase 3-like n=1 Tax=Stylophora pistillata TaxID=50429 RepID=UPI000C0462D6|nr:carbohydrate sulfotransferase 3-like [Stylophora pistillata]XP_022802892.1 carbohydrate sulfotransferase 3-like [Stylophora pistillata]